MATAEQLEAAIEAAQAAVTRQGDNVRSLKASVKDGKATKDEVTAAIEELKNLKLALETAQKVNVLERRLFYMPSFRIYGGVAGFYDYGPPGCAIKSNIQQFWRQHFVIEEGMLEVECPAVTPEPVLKASGHVERFTDLMVTDVETGDCHRADHLLEHALEAVLEDRKNPPTAEQKKEARDLLARVGELTCDDLHAALTKYGVKAPETGNAISSPFPFNLMFKTSIGPRGDTVGYLRPETAQGIFVNFRDLLLYNGGKLPFAAAQIGQSYRNEIAPKAGLLRVREFTQAEIEHFVHPEDKSHPKFATVADLQPLLYSRALQMSDAKTPQRMRLGDAVSQGIIANETLAYFIGRTYQFMTRVGITDERLRFRQHLQHEMAHYAEDCWDAEVDTSYGWVECAGLADRSAYDLRAHTVASKQELVAFERFPEPRLVEQLFISASRRDLGVAYKKQAAGVAAALEGMCEGDALAMQEALATKGIASIAVDGVQYDIHPAMVSISKKTIKQAGRNLVPSVIEPSFGIGRIIYCMFEHCFYTREDARTAFRFTPVVAPVKATVFPLLQRAELNEVAAKMAGALTREGLATVVDTTGVTIGKRYARTDEIGVPFAVTVDYATLKDDTVTVRERDTMAQLTDMLTTWEAVCQKYPAQAPVAEDDK